MQVQNIECQLAIAQLKRYVAGQELPADVVSELEAHIKVCTDCHKFAQELQRTYAGGEQPDEDAPKKSPLDAVKNLVSGLKAKLPGAGGNTGKSSNNNLIPPPGTPMFSDTKLNMRMVFTSVGLALTLIAMSTIMRDPTRVFGAKANEKKVEAKQPDNQKVEESNKAEEEGEHELTNEQPHTEDNEEHTTTSQDAEHAPDNAAHADNSTAEHSPTKDESGSHGSDNSTHASRSGLALPGRPTMDESPIIKADPTKPRPTNSHGSSSGSHSNSRTSGSSHSRPGSTHRAPSHSSSTTRRPSGGGSSSSHTSGNSQNQRPPVRFYNPDGTEKK